MRRLLTVVLDALAISAVRDGIAFEQPVMLTPHAKEMAHLSGLSKDAVLARELSAEVPALIAGLHR